MRNTLLRTCHKPRERAADYDYGRGLHRCCHCISRSENYLEIAFAKSIDRRRVVLGAFVDLHTVCTCDVERQRRYDDALDVPLLAQIQSFVGQPAISEMDTEMPTMS